MNHHLPVLALAPKTGDEPLHGPGAPVGATLRDFWQWSASDLVNNAMRGMLAEFIVATLLDSRQTLRVEWDAVDLHTPDGLAIEVKSAAYVQSWAQREHSAIGFDVGRKRAFDPATNDYSGELRRHADVYVFCLLAHLDQETIDPLDLAQWRFFVLSAAHIDRELGAQKRVGLARLRAMGAVEVGAAEVRAAVRAAGASAASSRTSGLSEPAEASPC